MKISTDITEKPLTVLHPVNHARNDSIKTSDREMTFNWCLSDEYLWSLFQKITYPRRLGLPQPLENIPALQFLFILSSPN